MDNRSEQLFEKHRDYILGKAAEFYGVLKKDLIKTDCAGKKEYMMP